MFCRQTQVASLRRAASSEFVSLAGGAFLTAPSLQLKCAATVYEVALIFEHGLAKAEQFPLVRALSFEQGHRPWSGLAQVTRERLIDVVKGEALNVTLADAADNERNQCSKNVVVIGSERFKSSTDRSDSFRCIC
jgi:hypothetical protein